MSGSLSQAVAPSRDRLTAAILPTASEEIWRYSRIDELDLDVELEAGEEIRVEISSKFRPEDISAEVTDNGFELAQLWSGNGDFGLLLARRI